MATIGVITEQNDLGLGFDPLNAQDQKTYSESTTTAANQQQSGKQKPDEK